MVTTVVAWVSPGCHAEICPERLAKRKRLAVLSGRAKPVVGLNAVPVGRGWVPTVSNGWPGVIVGRFRYSVLLSDPLFETHSGVVGPKVMPHGLIRLGSVIGAPTAGSSATRTLAEKVTLPRSSPRWCRSAKAGAAVNEATPAASPRVSAIPLRNDGARIGRPLPGGWVTP